MLQRCESRLVAHTVFAVRHHPDAQRSVFARDSGADDQLQGGVFQNQRGVDERQDDADEDVNLAATLYFRGLVHFAGDAADELHDQEDEKSLAEETGHEQRQVGVDPAQFVEEDVLRNELNLIREHESQDHACEPKGPAGGPFH